MSIRFDYERHMDQYGFVTPDANVCDNGVRFSTEYLFALKRHGELREEDLVKYRKLFLECELQPGLLIRRPGAISEQESVDNTYANIAADTVLGHGYASRFLEYGQQKVTEVDRESSWGQRDINRKYGAITLFVLKMFGLNKYIYNNVVPLKFNFSAWLGRQRALVSHAKLVKYGKLNPIDKFFWLLGLFLSARDATGQDSKWLSFFCIKASEGKRSFLMRQMCKYWSNKLEQQWPDGMGGVSAAYFNNPNHPTAVNMKGEYGR